MGEIENKIKDRLTEAFGNKIEEVAVPRDLRMFVRVSDEALLDVTRFLFDNFKFTHVSTITGLDIGNELEIIYHLQGGGTFLGLKTRVPKSMPIVKSICGIIPGANWYERELNDILGIIVDGHPDPRRLILPEDWPDNTYPLRKDWKAESVLPEHLWWDSGEIKKDAPAARPDAKPAAKPEIKAKSAPAPEEAAPEEVVKEEPKVEEKKEEAKPEAKDKAPSEKPAEKEKKQKKDKKKGGA